MHFVVEQQYLVSQLRYLSGMLCIIIPIVIVRLRLGDSSADAATAGCCRRLQECQQKRSHNHLNLTQQVQDDPFSYRSMTFPPYSSIYQPKM
mmetsp:Transcript_20705/g.27426  ORF Transcript_20705/g.27426 Transcript_20705/m.27426 type:complete len:92 (+) Transcript_20705:521-796(+)